MKTHVLIVEDEASIADNIRYALESEGFEATWVSTIREAHTALFDQEPDLILLDVGLPDGSGTDFCKTIRKTSDCPVIFLTARGSEIDRVVGLEIGGDDYITKPFSPRELTARIRAILRRCEAASGGQADADSPKQGGVFDIDESRCRIRYFGEPLQVSRYEYKLLAVMIRNPGRIYSRRQLMDQVTDDPDVSLERTVDTHIKTIRSKLRSIRDDVEAIITHRGFGYALNDSL